MKVWILRFWNTQDDHEVIRGAFYSRAAAVSAILDKHSSETIKHSPGGEEYQRREHWAIENGLYFVDEFPVQA